MTTEPPAGGGWQPPAGGYPPPQHPGGLPPAPNPFPSSYPPPAYPSPAPGADRPLPDPPPGPGLDGPLPEPPPDAKPALHWGDPTPAPAPPPRPGPLGPTSKLAVTALVLGALAGGAGLALLVGAAALVRLRWTHKRGAQLAVTGMVLTVMWAAAAGAFYFMVLSKPELRDANGVVTRKEAIAVDQLRLGDCIENWAASNKVGKLTVLPCVDAHNAEVFHTFDLTGTDYPGDGPVTEQATKQCLDKSKTAVKAEDLKNAKVALLKPIRTSWADGERQVTCVTVQNSGTITRSIRT